MSSATDIGTKDLLPLLVRVTTRATFESVRADLKARGLTEHAFRAFANGAIMIRPNGTRVSVLRHGGDVEAIMMDGAYVRCMCDAEIG